MRTPAKVLPKTPRSRPVSDNNLIKDPVQVYCRVRPMQCESDLSCLRTIPPTTVVLTPPEMAINYKIGNLKETQYIFKHIFDDRSTQRDVFCTVAQPLVENLIRGKNGLLFTYGVTGSGKTFTMTGDVQNRGIMPRCLDILFKTISDYQTKKYVFKPDRMNGFDILSDVDAMMERQAEMNSKLSKGRRKDSDPEIASRASTDVTTLDGIDEDNMYSVFVTYIEVYNNSVYDLLEEGPVQKTLQSKIVREDSTHNMFVHGVTEIEVKSVEDAIEAFQTGQKRKRMGHTILNAESSRSHSVFTVRLVQAPVDSQGEYIVQDRKTITVSQLSLVDLAGSERTNRTKNTGQRLREAGNINNSLMTLRTCLEFLRENQMTGGSKKIPYRDSKVTHLFKNYFDGDGQVRMIVCVNPRAEDYDETAQIMKFAEMTQEVQISRPTPAKIDSGLQPGRRKANQIFKIAINNLEENGNSDARKLDIDLGLVYSLGPGFPDFRLNSPECDRVILLLMQHLEQRIQKRAMLLSDLNIRQDRFRMHLLDMEKENLTYKTENSTLKAMLNQERQKTIALENKIVIHESSLDDLNRKYRDQGDQLRTLQRQNNEKQQLISQKELEKEKQMKKFTSKFAVETDKMSRELEIKLKKQKSKMEERMRIRDEKLSSINHILNSNKMPVRSLSSESISQEVIKETPTTSRTPMRTGARNGVVVANTRHRRSRSTGDRWLEHRSPNPVQLGTILQPYFKNRKSITKLTDAKDLSNSKTSKYCLISQGADTDGELETKLYKGDVIPTTGGGAQVIFNDVECLKQMSPSGSPSRKRPSLTTPGKDIKDKCSVAIEGHSSKKSRNY